MATFELVVEVVNDTLTFPISEEHANTIAVLGVIALKEILSTETVCKLDVLDIESLAIRDDDLNAMVWTYNAVKFGHPINEVYCTTPTPASLTPKIPDVKPPKLENLNDMFKQLVSWNERFHPSERPVIGADSTDTTNRVESQLKQLIFDMYEHEHAVTPAPPAPPKGLHDCKGTYVGDLIHNYNHSQLKHGLEDYVKTGWTREQLLKEKMFIVAPQPPCAAPATPVTTVEQKELAIGQLLLDLQDNNLPESVRILVELLANLKSE